MENKNPFYQRGFACGFAGLYQSPVCSDFSYLYRITDRVQHYRCKICFFLCDNNGFCRYVADFGHRHNSSSRRCFYLILGNVPRAIGFVVLYIVILIVRQFLEPKVMGQNLGLHPLVTLISIYVGMQIFGIPGLFLGPIIVAIVRALQKARILPQWKV
jgi:hypothetical protein